MDPLTHLTQKIMADRARQPTNTQLPTPTDIVPPPPYTAADSDNDEDDGEDAEPEESLRLTINAQHAIHGNANLVPTSPTPLADATKFSTLLLHAVQQLNAAMNAQGEGRRGVKVDLTINCGVTIVGDRNVIGNVGLKPKVPVASGAAAGQGQALGQAGAANAVAGAKRWADEDPTDEPEAKRVSRSETSGPAS